MKSLKAALWVAAIGCLTAVPFIALPWSVVDKIALLFGIELIPNDLSIFRNLWNPLRQVNRGVILT